MTRFKHLMQKRKDRGWWKFWSTGRSQRYQRI